MLVSSKDVGIQVNTEKTEWPMCSCLTNRTQEKSQNTRKDGQ